MKKTLLLLGLAAVVTTNLFAGETLNLKLVTDREVVLKGSPSEVIVKIDLSAIAERKKSRRTPLNLAVVLDRSGSMTGAKLEKTKQAAMQLVDRLAPNDIFSLSSAKNSATTAANRNICSLSTASVTSWLLEHSLSASNGERTWMSELF